jgi:hypothetical protein
VHHFVSYEGASANIKKGHLATAATWCLMRAGKRWPVMEQVAGQSAEELDAMLLAWLEQQNFPAESGRTLVDAGNTSRWDRRWPSPVAKSR